MESFLGQFKKVFRYKLGRNRRTSLFNRHETESFLLVFLAQLFYTVLTLKLNSFKLVPIYCHKCQKFSDKCMWLPTFTLIALWIKSGIHCFSYCVRVVLWVLVKREGIVVIGNKKYLIRYKLVSQLTGSAKARPRLKQRGAPKKVPTNYLRPNFFSLFPKVICSFHYWLKSFFLLNIIV